MRRSNLGAWTLIAMVGVLGGAVLSRPLRVRASNAQASDRPGDAAYTPTKLQWAALELQAGYGQTEWTTETPVVVTFSALDDGRTVLCLLQYTPEVSAETVKINRDAEQIVFKKFADSRGWSWLRLQFQEQVLPRPSR